MRKTLIFGSSGLIGTSLKKLISSESYHNKFYFLTSRDLDLTNYDNNKKYNFKKYLSDNCNIIFLSGIKKQYGDNIKIYDLNLKMIKNLILILNNYKNIFISFISSTEVFEKNNLVISESSKINSNTFYGKYKIKAEKLLFDFCKKKKFKLNILRPAQIYGVKDYIDAYGPTQFINKSIKNKTIELWGDGTELREFIYVKDVAKIILIVNQKQIKGDFNIVSGTSYNYMMIIKIVMEFFDNCKFISKKRTGEKYDLIFDNKKILGILPKSFNFTKLNIGIKEYINEIQKQKK